MAAIKAEAQTDLRDRIRIINNVNLFIADPNPSKSLLDMGTAAKYAPFKNYVKIMKPDVLSPIAPGKFVLKDFKKSAELDLLAAEDKWALTLEQRRLFEATAGTMIDCNLLKKKNLDQATQTTWMQRVVAGYQTIGFIASCADKSGNVDFGLQASWMIVSGLLDLLSGGLIKVVKAGIALMKAIWYLGRGIYEMSTNGSGEDMSGYFGQAIGNIISMVLGRRRKMRRMRRMMK